MSNQRIFWAFLGPIALVIGYLVVVAMTDLEVWSGIGAVILVIAASLGLIVLTTLD